MSFLIEYCSLSQLSLCRCAVIPLLSKEFYRIHRQYVPQRTSWLIKGPITQPMITWFKSGAYQALESLELESLVEYDDLETDLEDESDPWYLLTELLALVAHSLPRLRRLSLLHHRIDVDDILDLIPEHSNESPVQSLTGLQCLTVRMLLYASAHLVQLFDFNMRTREITAHSVLRSLMLCHMPCTVFIKTKMRHFTDADHTINCF